MAALSPFCADIQVDLQINYLYQLLTRPLPWEPSTSGPQALGPQDFVTKIIDHYISWLTREVVESSLGASLVANNGSENPRKVLVSAAILPLIADEYLGAMFEKYVAQQNIMAALEGSLTARTTMEDLLAAESPLCTYAVRLEMTKTFNVHLEAFCKEHSDVLAFIDINPYLLDADGNVDVKQYASSSDPTK